MLRVFFRHASDACIGKQSLKKSTREARAFCFVPPHTRVQAKLNPALSAKAKSPQPLLRAFFLAQNCIGSTVGDSINKRTSSLCQLLRPRCYLTIPFSTKAFQACAVKPYL